MDSNATLYEQSNRRITTLANFNNDCFLNTAIQLLYRTPSFVENLRSVCNPTNSSAASLLVKLFSKMDEPFNQPLTPTCLRSILKSDYTLGEQHDAHEVLMTLIELVRKATNDTASSDDRDEMTQSAGSRVHWEEFAENEGKSFMLSLMYGQTSTTLSCSWCTGGETKTFDAFSTITLHAVTDSEIPLSTDGMLSRYSSGRVTDVSLKCDKCNCTRRKVIRTSFSRLPTHLFFQINRVDDKMTMSEASIRLQPDLDMSPYLSEFIPKAGAAKYALYSVIEYYYTETGGGHYTIMSLCDGNWYLFDDGCASPMDSLPEFSFTAYLLAYTRS